MDTEYIKQKLEQICFTPFTGFTFNMKQWTECMPYIGKDWSLGINKVKILFLTGWSSLDADDAPVFPKADMYHTYKEYAAGWYKDLRPNLKPEAVERLSYAKNVDNEYRDVHVSKIEDALKAVFPKAGDDVLRKAAILKFWARPIINRQGNENKQQHHNEVDSYVSLSLLKEVVKIMEPDCIIACGSGIRGAIMECDREDDSYRYNGFWNTITFNFEDGTSHECGLIMSDAKASPSSMPYTLELHDAIRTAALMDVARMSWNPRRNHG